MSTATTKQLPKIQPRPAQKPVHPESFEGQQQQATAPAIESGESILIDLGFSSLIAIDPKAYCSAHAQIEMTEPARVAMKRLSLTLASSGERLSSGKVVGTSVANAIVWLCEKLAESAN